jgi:uncharacterized protein (DUF433 family)
LGVTWGTATPKIGLDIYSSYGDGQINIRTTGGIANATSSEVAVRSGTATFAGVGIPVTWKDGSPVSSFTVSSWTASVDGFFAGAAAERAGLTYWEANSTFAGNAVFALSSLDVGAPGGGGGGGAFTASLDTSSPPLAMVYAGPSTFTNTTVGITPVTQDSSTGLVTAYTPAETVTINTAQGADMGGDALITWGRWVNGTSRSSGTGGGPYDLDTIGAEQGFHYVIGKPSPSLPASGTANFTLLGATNPTFGDGALPAGTLTSAAMAVEWGGAATRVGVDMTLTMPSDGTYRVMTTGGTTTPGTSEISTTFGDARFQGSGIPVTTTGGARACAGGTCAAKVEGLFTGTNGARAGLVYTVNNGIFFGQPTSVVGAAAFIKQ